MIEAQCCHTWRIMFGFVCTKYSTPFMNSLRALSMSQVEEMFEAETLAVRTEGEQEEKTKESLKRSSRKIKDRLKARCRICGPWSRLISLSSKLYCRLIRVQSCDTAS